LEFFWTSFKIVAARSYSPESFAVLALAIATVEDWFSTATAESAAVPAPPRTMRSRREKIRRPPSSWIPPSEDDYKEAP